MAEKCKYRHDECTRRFCSNCELNAVVDDNCQRLMLSAPKYVPMEPGTYRLSVQVWIKCPSLYGLYVLQKRTHNTGYSPGMWSPLTGGVKAGEDVSSTIRREAKEELGIEVTNLKFIARQKHEEHFEEVWYAEDAGSTDPNAADINFVLQKEEVDTITFVKGDDIKKFFEEGTLMEDSYFKTYIPNDL